MRGVKGVYATCDSPAMEMVWMRLGMSKIIISVLEPCRRCPLMWVPRSRA